MTLRDSFRLSGRRSAHAIGMAAAVACAMPTTALAATNLESESMSVAAGVAYSTDNATASGGKTMTLFGDGAITKAVTTDRATRLVVRASGDQCEGPPSMQVDVDGNRVLTTSVVATTLTDYTAAVDLAAGSHTVRITFSNDLLRPGVCDRNLVIDRVTFGTPRPASRPSR